MLSVVETSAGIPALVHGVQLGDPPRTVSLPLRAFLISGRIPAQLGALTLLCGVPGVVVLGAFPLASVLVLPLIVAGAVLVLSAAKSGVLAARLLRYGILARGSLVGRVRQKQMINGQHVELLTFRFSDDRGAEHEMTARTHDVETLVDAVDEALLYDPWQPEHAVLLGDLPGKPRLDDEGAFRLDNPGQAVFSLLFPGLALLTCVLAVLRLVLG